MRSCPTHADVVELLGLLFRWCMWASLVFSAPTYHLRGFIEGSGSISTLCFCVACLHTCFACACVRACVSLCVCACVCVRACVMDTGRWMQGASSGEGNAPSRVHYLQQVRCAGM